MNGLTNNNTKDKIPINYIPMNFLFQKFSRRFTYDKNTFTKKMKASENKDSNLGDLVMSN